MWWYYTGGIALVCFGGLVWLMIVASRGRGASNSLGILIGLPLLVGTIVLSVVTLMGYAESATGVSTALTNVSTAAAILHRGLHIVLGGVIVGILWLIRGISR